MSSTMPIRCLASGSRSAWSPLSSKPCLGGSTGNAHRVVNELKYMLAPRIVLCAAPDAGRYVRAIRTSVARLAPVLADVQLSFSLMVSKAVSRGNRGTR